jgi:hypothetical protein
MARSSVARVVADDPGSTAPTDAMNFRIVWMGPDEEPLGTSPNQNGAPARHSGALPRYVQSGAEMIHQEQRPNGRVKITPLANFQARIVQDLVLDDGQQQQREFGLAAQLGDKSIAFCVNAAEFARMGWVLSKLGPQAIIYPGQSQHARAAIQSLSGPLRSEFVFTHLGWRKEGSQWLYLHGGGALGSGGAVPVVRVRLPAALRAYQLGQPRDAAEAVSAVQDSLHFLEVAPDRISFPLWAGVYRAAFGDPGFSLFLSGPSGVFKTTLAALCQQHFGAGLDARHLPANFASTGNALEWLAFYAKDAVLVMDDFAPTGLRGDGELYQVAERVFRGAGNGQGRNRMVQNGRVNALMPPRALILATGEAVPMGASIRARLLIVEVATGEVRRTALAECQKAAAQGRFAVAMSAFLGWTAGRYENLQARLRERVEELRSQGQGRRMHARIPSAVAQLQAAFEIWLEFAVECGAINHTQREQLTQRSSGAWNELLTRQAQYHQASDPAGRFLLLLQAALKGGQAHVADRDGNAPDVPELWGWRRRSSGRVWAGQGVRMGWLAGSDLYLEPTVSYDVAQQMAGTERLSVTAQKLRQQLRERQMLASVDEGRNTLLVRRTLEGCPRQVLHLKARELTVNAALDET